MNAIDLIIKAFGIAIEDFKSKLCISCSPNNRTCPFTGETCTAQIKTITNIKTYSLDNPIVLGEHNFTAYSVDKHACHSAIISHFNQIALEEAQNEIQEIPAH